jgi:hypothetical protein
MTKSEKIETLKKWRDKFSIKDVESPLFFGKLNLDVPFDITSIYKGSPNV